MARKLPYFPFYVNDFAADAVVETMTTQEVGAYILLLCKAWHQSPPGSIPNNDIVLARWARLDLDDWQECRARVLSAFDLQSDNRWHQKRMRKEYAKLLNMLEGRSHGGRKGARKRWGDDSPNGSVMTDPLGKPMAPNFGSESESGSGSDPPGGDGGSAGGRGGDRSRSQPALPLQAGFEPTAAGLARAWFSRTVRRRQGVPRDDPGEVEAGMADLIRTGSDPAVLLADVLAESRSGLEQFWEFVARHKPKHTNGQRGKSDAPNKLTQYRYRQGG